MIAISLAATRGTYAILKCVTVERDCWAEWVARTRPGEDGDHPHWRWRDRILLAAEPIAGETVLDVGCGEGLVAFGALDRGAREVVFDDISEDLLAFCRTAARERGVLDRCRFVRATAEDLAPVGAASVDVVTTRSVLIYVEGKQSAFREFARVLRPGGRLSIFEPINRFGREFRESQTFWGYPLDGLATAREKVNAVYETIQPRDDPMLDFDERDLVTLAVEAGFFPVALDVSLEVTALEPLPWDRFANTPGNPKIPSLAEAMDQALTQDERDRVTAHLRPFVERGDGVGYWAKAFLHATKPAA